MDYAIVTRTGGEDSPLEPETIVTRSQDEITSPRTNSVYMTHDPFQGLKLDSSKRYAMVCLPCQVKRAKYEFVICLICNHSPSKSFTDDVLNDLEVSRDQVASIQYRGHGWPGYFTAHLKDGLKKSVALTQYWNRDHKPAMCRGCKHIGRGADILAGDPWRLGLEKTDQTGQTLVVCLTSKGHEATKGATDYIEVMAISEKDLWRAHDKYLERGRPLSQVCEVNHVKGR